MVIEMVRRIKDTCVCYKMIVLKNSKERISTVSSYSDVEIRGNHFARLTHLIIIRGISGIHG